MNLKHDKIMVLMFNIFQSLTYGTTGYPKNNYWDIKTTLIIIGCLIILSCHRVLSVSVRSYGDTCFSDDQCVDHHMLCIANETESSVGRCYCNRYNVESGVVWFSNVCC